MLLLMLKYGINPKVAQQRLDHSSIKTTLDIYTYVVDDIQKEAAKILDEEIFRRAK